MRITARCSGMLLFTAFAAPGLSRFQVVPAVLGAGLYVFIAVIAIRALRGAGEEQLRLSRVETVGLYLLWATFALSFAPRAGQSALYLALTLAAFAALGARLLPRGSYSNLTPVTYD